MTQEWFNEVLQMLGLMMLAYAAFIFVVGGALNLADVAKRWWKR